MTKLPNKPDAPILGKLLISRMILVALSMGILTIAMYAFYSAQYGHDYGRTIAFCSLVVMQWANAFNARSDDESLFTRIRVFNGKFYIGLTVAVILQMLAIYSPLGNLLHITPVTIGDLVITGVISFVMPIALVEVHKYIGRRFFGRSVPKREHA